MQSYVVIGIGRYGFHIAKRLAKQSQVLAIDINPDKVEKIEGLVHKAVVGDAKDRSFISGIIDKDVSGVVICMGSDMVDSIVLVHYLKELNVNNIIIKANNEMHAELLKFMGVTGIFYPEKDIAESLTQKLTNYLPTGINSHRSFTGTL